MNPIIEVKNVSKFFYRKNLFFKQQQKEHIQAVKDVSLSIFPGDVVGLVGESGSGKTTLGKLILGLIKLNSGNILIDNIDFKKARTKQKKQIRKNCRMIYQSLDASLNPGMKVLDIIKEPLDIHTHLSKEDKIKRIKEILISVNLDETFLNKLPNSLSGGEKRRVSIARALVVTPSIIIADEPLASLDASLRYQIIILLQEIIKKYSLTMIFISHDISSISHLCNKIIVMYNGNIVEINDTKELINGSIHHPYTKLLLSSMLDLNRKEIKNQEITIIDENIIGPEKNEGCDFVSNCPLYLKFSNNGKCLKEKPILKEISEKHLVQCHYVGSDNE